MKCLCNHFLWVLLCLFLTGNTYATSIVINPGTGLSANIEALAAFSRAASTWESIFMDPITVNINADLAALPSGALSSTSSVLLSDGYDVIRDQMVADAADEANNGVVAALPTAAQASAWVPSGFGLSGNIWATKANLKAMGFSGLDTVFGATDADISFSSTFGFDYDNSDGVGAGLFDFETVAAHEIGHVLGFVSDADYADVLINFGLTDYLAFRPMDLFRFGNDDNPATLADFTNNPRMLAPGEAALFDDLDNEWAFSTGRFNGDGNQASHWKADEDTGKFIGLMDPTIASGTAYGPTYADIRAFDLIGWDPIPERSTLVLVSTGLVFIIASGLRRKKK